MNLLTGKEILNYIRYLDDHVKAYKKRASFRPSKRIGFWSSTSYVEKLAKEMATEIGLSDCHFKIELCNDLKDVAGEIDLREHLGFTFIRIDRKFLDHFDTLVAVLAHELSHKFLHKHTIEFTETFANECLTDITSIYLGFGKYALNGKCYKAENYSGTVGYLDHEMFAFVYDVVSFDLGLLEEQTIAELSGSAVNALQTAREKFHDLYPPEALAYRAVFTQLLNAEQIIKEIEPKINRLVCIDMIEAGEWAKTISNTVTQFNTLTEWLKHLQSAKAQAIGSDDPQTRYNFCSQVVQVESRAESLKRWVPRLLSHPELMKMENKHTSSIIKGFKYCITGIDMFINKHAWISLLLYVLAITCLFAFVCWVCAG